MHAVNVALPSIGRELGAGVSGLQWTVDAYTVVMAGLLMFSGSLADRIGRRRTFVAGLMVFTAASVACGLAPGADSLIAFRALQAVGASMLNPVAMSIIANTFTDPRERAQAVGVWGAVFGISMALGPVVGGTVVAAFATFGGFLFLNTLYLQQARGLSPAQAGLATVPLALMTVVASPISGRIVGRRGPRIPLAITGVCMVSACVLLTGIGPATPLAQLLAEALSELGAEDLEALRAILEKVLSPRPGG